MDVLISFKSGAEFSWKAVKASELNSVFADIADLPGKIRSRKNGLQTAGQTKRDQKASSESEQQK